MITGADIYRVLSSVLPLYVSIFLGYASIRIFKILTVEQCAGVNRYVALIAVPTLGFQVSSKRMSFMLRTMCMQHIWHAKHMMCCNMPYA